MLSAGAVRVLFARSRDSSSTRSNTSGAGRLAPLLDPSCGAADPPLFLFFPLEFAGTSSSSESSTITSLLAVLAWLVDATAIELPAVAVSGSTLWRPLARLPRPVTAGAGTAAAGGGGSTAFCAALGFAYWVVHWRAVASCAFRLLLY